MRLLNSQKPLSEVAASQEETITIVAIPAGTQPASVITASYNTGGLNKPIVSNKAGSLGALSPFDGTAMLPPVEAASVDPINHTSLLKVGECANCSCDLYADNATANAMQEHAHFGSCVLCGAPVSYTNTGELAQIATSVERYEQGKEEVSNYFDFTELQTVDPNKVEENDMSESQARRALRASVATAIKSIVTTEQASDDTVDMLPSDDEDFASESEDDSELEVMDMDESDPSEDEAEEDEDSEEEIVEEEEASINEEIPVAADAPEVPEAPLVTAETPAVTEAVETPVVEEAPAIVLDTPAVETPVVSNDTVIEYVAATPADISPSADLIPVSEAAYYVVQDDAPVAVLRKENASAGAQSLWHKPVELRSAFRASMAGNRSVALASFGGAVLRHTTNVGEVIAQRITASETASAAELATQRASLTTQMRQCLEVAALGITKGMFGAKFANPVVAELANVLTANGVREPQAIVRASMIHSMPDFINVLLEKAAELATESADSLAAKAELVGNAEFAPLAPTIAAPAEPAAPETARHTPIETAAPKKRYDISRMTSGLGRQAHA